MRLPCAAWKKKIDDILATEYYDSVERIAELAQTAKSWQEIQNQLKPPAKRDP